MYVSEAAVYNPSLPIHIGIDWGLTPAALLGQVDVMGRWTWIDEVVTGRMGAKQLGSALRKHIQKEYPGCTIGHVTGDPAGETSDQGDETSNAFKMFCWDA